VPTSKLYINLCERVFDPITQIDQTIVNADRVEHDGGNCREEYHE
jgi:hypothetical protein